MLDTRSIDTETPPPSVITDAKLMVTVEDLLEDLRRAFWSRDMARVRANIHLLGICADDLR